MVENTGSKIIIIISLAVMVIVGVFFIMSKNNITDATEDFENITSLNVDTYDLDVYIYEIDTNKLYTSEYFYNKIYLDNNEVMYEEFDYNSETKFYLKTLSNTPTDINNVKTTYDHISIDEFKFLLENYSLLKVDIWLDDSGVCDKVLLYANNEVQLDLEGY